MRQLEMENIKRNPLKNYVCKTNFSWQKWEEVDHLICATKASGGKSQIKKKWFGNKASKCQIENLTNHHICNKSLADPLSSPVKPNTAWRALVTPWNAVCALQNGISYVVIVIFSCWYLLHKWLFSNQQNVPCKIKSATATIVFLSVAHWCFCSEDASIEVKVSSRPVCQVVSQVRVADRRRWLQRRNWQLLVRKDGICNGFTTFSQKKHAKMAAKTELATFSQKISPPPKVVGRHTHSRLVGPGGPCFFCQSQYLHAYNVFASSNHLTSSPSSATWALTSIASIRSSIAALWRASWACISFRRSSPWACISLGKCWIIFWI